MTYDEAKEQFTLLFNHEMSDYEMREFLVSMKLDEHTSVEAIAAAAEVMRSKSIPLPISEDIRLKAIDVVGTGGDKIGSFNISSTVALLVAASGSYVAKHGSRSVTSKSGSADAVFMSTISLCASVAFESKILCKIPTLEDASPPTIALRGTLLMPYF
jgi:anthranilate phosphoribosyltransferase